MPSGCYGDVEGCNVLQGGKASSCVQSGPWGTRCFRHHHGDAISQDSQHKLVSGFFMFPWAPKRPWTLKGGPGTGSEDTNGKDFCSDERHAGHYSKGFMSNNSLNPHNDLKKHVLLLSPFRDKETEAEFQIPLCSGASVWVEMPAPAPVPRSLPGRMT